MNSNFGPTLTAVVSVTDDHDGPQGLKVTVHWEGFANGANGMSWDGFWFGAIGPVPFPGQRNQGGTLTRIWVTATDSAGATSVLEGVKIAVRPCPEPIIVP
jgi:putative peptide zinc metalloprotease protein